MHSALKKDGKALYEYAREGIEVERAPREVVIYKLALAALSDIDIRIEATVSKGTYIRTLGEDIGAALGCGAHLDALRRVASGALDIEAATTLAQLDGLDEASLDARLLPPDALVAAWPRVVLTNDDAGRFLAGVRRRLNLDDAPALRVYGPERGAFLGTGHVVAGELIASRLLSPAEVGDLVAARRQPHSVSESLFA
jgi:tRNA pseudouridine55 synthase